MTLRIDHDLSASRAAAHQAIKLWARQGESRSPSADALYTAVTERGYPLRMTRPSPSPSSKHKPPSRRVTLRPGLLIALAVAGGGLWLVSTLAERPSAAAPMNPAMPGMPGMNTPPTASPKR